ncbi:MAG: HAD-IIA family hydrolase [Candidatus Bathyarchaeia archaeon]
MLREFKGIVLDLDGCIYLGDAPIPGALEAVRKLRTRGKKLLFLTNNATKTPAQYVKKLRSMGVTVHLEEILTSATATAQYISRKFGPSTVYAIGERALFEALHDAGHKTVKERNSKKAGFVVVGLDFGFTYQKIAASLRAIAAGAKFLATNTDRNLPVENGFEPGAGALVSAISTAAGVEPIVIGKPSRYILEIAMEKLGTPIEKTVIVGDRPETDIEAGNSIGAFTVLVLSGSTKEEDLVGIKNQRHKPKLTLPTISNLADLT